MKAAYDYRAFGEQVVLTEPADKVTENFTGKELDDEIALNYFGARYLDPMLGMWISVDPARQFASDYALRLYCGPKSIEKNETPKGYKPYTLVNLPLYYAGRLVRKIARKFTPKSTLHRQF